MIVKTSAAGYPIGLVSPLSRGNQPCVLKQNLTSINMSGTSINTPTTVASAAPDDNPYNMVDVAIATSKWLDAPIMAVGAAFS